jgi:hypothetical protein
VIEDGTVYTQKEITDLLRMIDDGNKAAGGLIKAVPLFYGILGWLRLCASTTSHDSRLHTLHCWLVCPADQATGGGRPHRRALRLPLRRNGRRAHRRQA